jgi:1,4-alpha-glucan branching enzyme
MPFPVRVHFDNSAGFVAPHLWVWYDGAALGQDEDLAQTGADTFGPFFEFTSKRNFFRFKFKEGSGQTGPWELQSLERMAWPLEQPNGNPDEIWCKGDRAFVYHVIPRAPEAVDAPTFLSGLSFKQRTYVPGTGGFSGLGANPLRGSGVLFGLYHPNAARVYIAGTFNNWQSPAADAPREADFRELKLYRGWFGAPNTWLGIVQEAAPGDEYKFVVHGGIPSRNSGRAQDYFTDPYTRRLGPDFDKNNGVIEDPSAFGWTDGGWTTPDIADLILYELSVYGFTEGDPDINAANRGRFSGIRERITTGYFGNLGVNALSLMPLVEVPSMQGPRSLGYDPSLYMTVERDFGTPDDLRALVNDAHRAGLAVLIDQVFNHTSSSFNPLWRMILEHPGEELSSDGGLYFNGTTDWGNRIATEKEDVQNMLIDACKLAIVEYHIDGFRFDATNTNYMDHAFLLRLAVELKGIKPNVLLVAENLPNQADLNLQGFDGFAQWCDLFHDKIKALLREGPFGTKSDSPDEMGDMFFFARQSFAAHTNNVVNYCESHDENSVANEVHYTPALDNPAAKDRKSRLGLFATMVALGQPMIYMGAEFGADRPRNIVTVEWPGNLEAAGFYQWCRRLIALRRRYPGLRLRGYNPAADGRFSWILAPWMDGAHGGGRRIIGWRSRPNEFAHDVLVVILNFESSTQTVDIEFGISGVWLKLADIETVNDIAPVSSNSVASPTAIRTEDGRFVSFDLPSSSGFIYKWEAGL